MLLPLAFLSPSFGEMALIAIIALLLYGSDLPEVARTWGKAYHEFRRNLGGIRNDLNDVIYAEPDSPRKLQYYPEFQETAADAEPTPEPPSLDETPLPETPAAPVATTPATGVKPATTVASDQPVRDDAHGAA